MRVILSLATFAMIAGIAAAQTPYSNEPNTYRYGGTYSTVSSGSATSCAALCGQDQTCQAWSFQRATKALGGARCELKSVIGRSIANPLMTSGINPRLASAGQAVQRRIPNVDTLLGAPTSTRRVTNVIRNSTVSSLPAAPRPIVPPPAPVQQFTSPPPPSVQQFTPPPPPAPVAQIAPVPRERINVPVTQGDLPPGAVLRDAPPPQVSFAPLGPTPAAPTIPPPPQPQSVTIPEATGPIRDIPRQLNTVPAGSIPPAPVSETKPYNNLRNREYPEYSVNSGSVLTPEEFAEQEALKSTIIENVEIDDIDLATDIGEPIVEDRIQQRRRSGGGGS